MIRTWATGIGPLGVNLKAVAARTHDGLPFEIVGVVRDVRNVPLGQAIEPAIYFTTRQFPFSEVFHRGQGHGHQRRANRDSQRAS